eukprot:SAG11_NODE_244_length_11735_cov_13.768900_6_plen_118_part_00
MRVVVQRLQGQHPVRKHPGGGGLGRDRRCERAYAKHGRDAGGRVKAEGAPRVEEQLLGLKHVGDGQLAWWPIDAHKTTRPTRDAHPLYVSTRAHEIGTKMIATSTTVVHAVHLPALW